MASKKTKTRNKWKLTQEQVDNIRKYSGFVVLGVTLFTLLSIVSYFFTWKVDAGLPQGSAFENFCGVSGYKWSNLLVARCFGLGSLFLVFLLGAISYKLIRKEGEYSLLRIAFITVSGTFLSSLLFSYVSLLVSEDTCLGGGLGGDAGAAVITCLGTLVGMTITGFIVLLLILGWLILSSSRFRHWFSVMGEKTDCPMPIGQESEADDDADEDDDAQEYEEEPEIEPEPDDDPDPIPELEPEPEPEPDGGEIEVVRGDDLVTEVVEELPPFDNRLDLEKFESPSLDLLNDYAEGQHKVSQQELETNINKIKATLLNYKIELIKVTAVVGPTVTLYKVYPAPGVRVASIETLHREIAMSLGVDGVRVVMLSDSVGIEVPNLSSSIVPLKSMLNSDAFRNTKAELPVAIGYTITQEVKTFDLADAPHLLVAGATKQGKSVGLNVIMTSLLYAKHPSELKFVIIDPKKVEFTPYNKLLKHYLAVLPAYSEEDEQKNAIVKNAKTAEQVLSSLCIEMDQRYALLEKAGVNDFKLYNEKYKKRHLLPTEGHMFLPYLVVVIDEYSDLLMAGGGTAEAKKAAKNVESSIVRLAQMGRAAGIHVIIATQRPSADVVTGLIRANFPTRIAFRVFSNMESRIILDSNGAENLIGKGDMLYYAGVKIDRVQCALISMKEVVEVTKAIGEQNGYKQCYNTPYYLPEPQTAQEGGDSSTGMVDMQNIDPMFEEAAKLVVRYQKASVSDLQRKLSIGFARAGRVMDQLEAAGVVGPLVGAKREVLVADFDELNEILTHFIG